jgi:hypothetical protein
MGEVANQGYSVKRYPETSRRMLGDGITIEGDHFQPPGFPNMAPVEHRVELTKFTRQKGQGKKGIPNHTEDQNQALSTGEFKMSSLSLGGAA